MQAAGSGNCCSAGKARSSDPGWPGDPVPRLPSCCWTSPRSSAWSGSGKSCLECDWSHWQPGKALRGCGQSRGRHFQGETWSGSRSSSRTSSSSDISSSSTLYHSYWAQGFWLTCKHWKKRSNAGVSHRILHIRAAKTSCFDLTSDGPHWRGFCPSCCSKRRRFEVQTLILTSDCFSSAEFRQKATNIHPKTHFPGTTCDSQPDLLKLDTDRSANSGAVASGSCSRASSCSGCSWSCPRRSGRSRSHSWAIVWSVPGNRPEKVECWIHDNSGSNSEWILVDVWTRFGWNQPECRYIQGCRSRKCIRNSSLRVAIRTPVCFLRRFFFFFPKKSRESGASRGWGILKHCFRPS